MRQLHPFQRRVLHYIQQEQLAARGDVILVAVSGGPDSVALLHVLAALEESCGISRLAILHFDHQLRGPASTADKTFVEALAATFGLPVHASSADVHSYRREHRMSLEMAARACRHRFFREALTRFGANAIALGHNANDQAEEVLLRLLRGTGPPGMAGMLPKTADHLIRPLLGVTRSEILTYLEDQQLAFREDATNLDPAHQRNVIRHKILPLLEHHFHPRVVEVLCRHTQLAKAEESFWNELSATRWQVLCVSETPSRVVLDAERLLAAHPALQRRLLRLALDRLQGHRQGIQCTHLEALRRLLVRHGPGRSLHLPRSLQATLDGPLLILSAQPPEASHTAVPALMPLMEGPGTYQFPPLRLSLTIQDRPNPPEPPALPHAGGAIFLDADKIRWPLFLRFWKKGDRFQPLGLGGTKKLQDFFVDLKIPRRARGRVPLLCDQEKICWVVNYRLDDRVKLAPQTRRVLIISKTDLDWRPSEKGNYK